MKSDLIPDYWREFLKSNSLAGKEIEFPWPGEDDLTACLEVLDEEMIEKEAKEYWPGIGILNDGYISIGGSDSGDQFCINVKEGKGGPLYLVDHERVGPEGYDKEETISLMLKSYEELRNYTKEEA